MKPAVLHIITGLETGGAERSLYNLIDGPNGQRFTHSVISLTGIGTFGPRLRKLGVGVTALDIKHKPWTVMALPKLVRKAKPDIVQGWMYHGNLAAALASPKSSALVWNIRTSMDDLAGHKPGTRWTIRANARLSGRPDRVLFNAEVARQQHIAAGFTAENTQVIPNGFDTTKFCPDPDLRASVRASLGIPESAVVIGQLGRFHPVKDHANFFEAALPLLDGRPDVHLVLAGRGVSYDTPFFTNAIPSGLSQRVHLLGDRSDAPAVLNAMDVFVQSSKAEGFPNGLGEAMSTGLACVATDVGDSARVLGGTGATVPPGDSAALNRQIEAFVDNPALRRDQGVQARARITSTYPLDSTSKAYTTLYESLLSSS